MGRLKNSVLLKGLMMLALFVTVAGLASIKAEAKGISDLKTLVGTGNVDTGTKNVFIRNAATVDGYDLEGYRVVIQAENVTFKNCTNVDAIVVQKSNCTISNNTITASSANSAYCGIQLTSVSNCKVTKNTISNVAGIASIYMDGCTTVTVSDNTITNSDHYGIAVNNDNSSIIKNNKVTNSANMPGITKTLHGDGILVDNNSNKTEVTGNTIDTVKSPFADWGNGLIVARSKDVKVTSNTIKNAHNHGIQVTYKAQNITLTGNTVTASGYQGVSVSRGSSANMDGNTVSGNVGNGIVYDGNETSYGMVSGTIANNICESNTEDGMYFRLSNVNVTSNKINKNGSSGIRVDNGCTTVIKSNIIADNVNNIGVCLMVDSVNTLDSNKIYLSTRKNGGYTGVAAYNSSKLTLTNNRIVNYGTSAVYTDVNTTVNATNNKVSVEGTTTFEQNAYAFMSNNRNVTYYHLIVNSITASSVAGQIYYDGYEAGAVVNKTEYPTTSSNGGKFTVSSFPAQSGADKVIIYTKDSAGNTIYVNAPKAFLIGGEKTPAQRTQIDNFVVQLYNVCLDRTPDASGIKYWGDILANDEQTGSEVAFGFVFSNEFKAKNYCNDDYLKHLYKAFMGREADEGGLNYWKEQMAQGMNREEVFNNFVGSGEFKGICDGFGIETGNGVAVPEYGTVPTNKCAQCGAEDDVTKFVKRMYEKVLDRPAEAGGLSFHCNNLWTHTKSGKEVAADFVFSPEFVGKGYDESTYLDYLYIAFMGRAADTSGKNYWLGKMSAGMSRQEVFDSFATSPEFQGICRSYGIKPF